MARILGGSFIGNTATVSGGVYYAPNSAQVHLYIGSAEKDGAKVLFQDNTAKSSGGVLYASTLSANVIYGNTSFINNSTTSGSGGAICMYGQLTVRGTLFEGNTASNRGGAIYVSKSSLEAAARITELTDCTFTANQGSLGGAVSLYAGAADFPEGAIANTVEILTTLKEKVINAANDTNTDDDRAQIQKELDETWEKMMMDVNERYPEEEAREKE